ncbi:MAG: diaminopimelate decarboxylase [Dehalococcoidales bacterium]|nr:diaminopimelate decarboxylase [Dehalococcoidales bacterium]
MAITQKVPRLSLFPRTAEINGQNHLVVGGCDTLELVKQYGTPLYVYDELGVRGMAAQFKNEFTRRYPDTMVIYASKAFINKAMALILKDEGLGLDVVSAGEINIAQSAGFPMDKLYFHGNNKSAEELELAVKSGIGRVVVDNGYELALLGKIAREHKRTQEILLRINPGIDPHTHKYNTTGIVDSKFGIPSAYREEVIGTALKTPGIKLVGLHFHLGSLILETDPYPQGVELALDFAASLKQKYGFEMKELDIGGGFGVPYTLDMVAPPVSAFAEIIAATIKKKCQELKLAQPRLIIEPGRAIVAQSAFALYTVGVVKEIPGVRCYVSVDGGMGDNIRFALYGAKHEALIANRATEKESTLVTISGKFCESGDIIIKDIKMPPLAAGDILAVADCGAYCIPMSSNYNAFLRPAVAMVKEGKSRLIRRRETFADLTERDLV